MDVAGRADQRLSRKSETTSPHQHLCKGSRVGMMEGNRLAGDVGIAICEVQNLHCQDRGVLHPKARNRWGVAGYWNVGFVSLFLKNAGEICSIIDRKET